MTNFKVLASDGKARAGRLTTFHGEVLTPVFLPVGTQASVKAVCPEDLKSVGCQMALGSTYHLYLRPGVETIEKLGGLHRFMNWDRPLFTDSGGFQVFSLGIGIEHEVGKMVPLFGDKLMLGDVLDSDTRTLAPKTSFVKIEEDGPTFKSHLDGTSHFFPPEKSVESQVKIGADFIVALDELTSPLHNYDYTKVSMERTHRWAKRSLDAHRRYRKGKEYQRMFGVIQGGAFEDLRIESTKAIGEMDFFGNAVGGALVDRRMMIQILDWIHPHLGEKKPRHLLGIGTIPDIFLGVERGMDMFDAVVPTRLARMGHILHKRPAVSRKRSENNIRETYNSERFAYDINKSVFSTDPYPLAADCSCYTCQNFTRAYVHHLFRSHELLVHKLTTIHNLRFMMKLMEEIRLAIEGKRFAKLKEEWIQ